MNTGLDLDMKSNEKRKLTDSYKLWWHSIDFGDGVWSDGSKLKSDDELSLSPDKRMAVELEAWNFPKDYFKGKSVLDIGAWDGFFSFHAEQNGASSVTALDDNSWTGKDESWSTKEGFDIAKKILGSSVQDVVMDIFDATPENLGTFDVVLFPGVLYHLKNPYEALSIIYDLLNEGGNIFVETTVTEHLGNVPAMVFHPKRSCGNDPSNYWSPNKLGLIRMLEEIGFIVDNFYNVAAADENYQARAVFYAHKEL
jgi:tRNA (mo5U34)-methyltransferase